ncbi:hypothetical protein DRJ22_00325 [Candidatus Woesearchaeota archaeon]|nr:MAG: hypothetical protein DRJ22_00325 [Candidatus Woesearchaeota archaeon]
MRNKQFFLLNILLLVVVFLVGIFVGDVLHNPGASVEKILKQSELSAESFIVEQALFDEFKASCPLAKKRLAVLSGDLWRLGKLLDSPTAKKDLGSVEYDFLKRKFHLMQIKTYILYKQLGENCGSVPNVILFYFSQSDKDSALQGKILDGLVKDFDLKVFAIEYNFSSDLMFLEDFYDVNSTPSIIINFKTKLEGLSSRDKIIPLLHEKS